MLTIKQILGRKIEESVSHYLQTQGLKLITNNYSCKLGEIDLVMQEGENLVFVEVRYRQTLNYGGGLTTVDQRKQQRVIKTAINYLKQHKLYEVIGCRFDVVAVSGRQPYTIEWVKNAFESEW